MNVLFIGGPYDGRRKDIDPMWHRVRLPAKIEPFKPRFDFKDVSIVERFEFVEYNIERWTTGHHVAVFPGLTAANVMDLLLKNYRV